MPIMVNTSRRPASMMRLITIFPNAPIEAKEEEWAPKVAPTLEIQQKVSATDETKSFPVKHKARVPAMITAK